MEVKDLEENVDVKAGEEVSQEASIPVVKKKISPKLFMKKDDHIIIDIVGYYSNEDGSLVFVLPKDMEKEISDKEEIVSGIWTAVHHRFEFTRVGYDKLNRYRKGSMIYNHEGKNNTINLVQLHDFFLVFHLVDWNYCDEDGNPIKFKFDMNGALSDESLGYVYSLPPMVLDLVFSIYEKRMNII